MRRTGWVVLALGLGFAAVFYGVSSRSADVALNDATALGYAKSMNHGMGVMMGTMGPMLTEWQQALTSPSGESLLIAAAAALLAGYFFRVAWVLDHDDEAETGAG